MLTELATAEADTTEAERRFDDRRHPEEQAVAVEGADARAAAQSRAAGHAAGAGGS